MNAATGRLALTAVLTLLVAIIVARSFDLSVIARLAPLVVGVPTLVLLGVELRRDFGRWRRADGSAVAERSRTETATGESILLWAGALVAGAYVLGLALGLSLFLALYLRLRSGERWTLAAASAAALFVFLYGVLEVLLRLPLHGGVLGFGW